MKMNQPISIAIIIPTCDRIASLRRALASVESEMCPEVLEVFVINNSLKALSEKTKSSLQLKGAPLRLLDCRERGQAAARNLGIQAASADYFLFLDDDCTLDIGFIKK